MGRFHKHHPLRLAIGLLLLGLVSSAFVGMVLGGATKWTSRLQSPLLTREYEVKSYNENGVPRRWDMYESMLGLTAMWTKPGSYLSNPAVYPVPEFDPHEAYRDIPRAPWWITLDNGPDAPSDWRTFSGWPIPSMSWHYDWAPVRGIRRGLILDKQERYIIPLRPNWPGLLANVPVHAAIWGVLLVAPGRVRAFIRRRKGLCAHCGYDVQELATCPECGEPSAR